MKEVKNRRRVARRRAARTRFRPLQSSESTGRRARPASGATRSATRSASSDTNSLSVSLRHPPLLLPAHFATCLCLQTLHLQSGLLAVRRCGQQTSRTRQLCWRPVSSRGCEFERMSLNASSDGSTRFE